MTTHITLLRWHCNLDVTSHLSIWYTYLFTDDIFWFLAAIRAFYWHFGTCREVSLHLLLDYFILTVFTLDLPPDTVLIHVLLKEPFLKVCIATLRAWQGNILTRLQMGLQNINRLHSTFVHHYFTFILFTASCLLHLV